VRRLAIESSHPDFLVRRWLARFGEARTRELLAVDNTPKPLHLLAFRDRGGRELLAERLIDAGVEVEPSALSLLGLVVRRGDPFASDAFADGDFYVQDEASQAAALLPPPRPGERVLDAAAAPGGKSFTLAAWEPSAAPVMADLDLGRLGVVVANLRRLRRRHPLLAADAARPPFAPRSLDRVLVDAPCSGLGTIRRDPDIRWRRTADDLPRLARDQVALLGRAAEVVEAGGRLVYATCSSEPEENEGVVEAFLAAHGEFHLGDLHLDAPSALSEVVDGRGMLRTLPFAHGLEAFFAAALIRR
jgi:16S rRNA (cytosine967-C5)-methyltransferase